MVEQTEIAAWRDMIDAAGDQFRISNGLRYKEIGGGLSINFYKTPVPLFNRVIGLEISEPITPGIINSIRNFYTHREKYIVHHSSAQHPPTGQPLLEAAGFKIGGAWERVVRRNESMLIGPDTAYQVEQVTESSKQQWATFLCDAYGFSFYEWPMALVERKGWKHYMALHNNKIIACRSFFTTRMRTVFSGVDAPVPGVMTTDCRPDFEIWKAALRDHLNEGALMFVADIEQPDKINNRDAYEGFKQLGFEIPYTRYHYSLQTRG